MALGARGIGAWPALVALTPNGLLPILRNTVVGLAGVDPRCARPRAASRMTPRDELWRVELPLAAAGIRPGLRTAAVWVVGTATLATPMRRDRLGTTSSAASPRATTPRCSSAASPRPRSRSALDQSIRPARGRDPRSAARVVGRRSRCSYLRARLVGDPRGGGVPAIARREAVTRAVNSSPSSSSEIRRGGEDRCLDRAPSASPVDRRVRRARGGRLEPTRFLGQIWRHHAPGDPGARRGELLAAVERYLADERGITVVARSLREPLRARDARRTAHATSAWRGSAISRARRARSRDRRRLRVFARAEWRALVAAYGLAFRAQRRWTRAALHRARERPGRRDQRVLDRRPDRRGRSRGARTTTARDPALRRDRAREPRLAREHPEQLAALRGPAGAIDADADAPHERAVDAAGRSPAEVGASSSRPIGGK